MILEKKHNRRNKKKKNIRHDNNNKNTPPPMSVNCIQLGILLRLVKVRPISPIRPFAKTPGLLFPFEEGR